MDFEKWVNELQCEIDKIKRKLATLSGGGSTVSITPTLESGEKVADYTIDETSGAIYAPVVSVTPTLQSGTKVADYSIGDTSGSIYTPSINDSIVARFGDLCMSRHIAEFTFNNSSSANINVSSVLPAGHTIIAVAGSALGGSFAFGFNTAKSLIAAKYTENLNATFTCNLIVFSVAPARTATKKKK